MFHFSRYGIIVLLSSSETLSQICSGSCSQARDALKLSPRHVTLSVTDLDVEKRWYITKLGFNELPAPQPAGPNGVVKGVELETPGYQIHLIQSQNSRRTDPPNLPVSSHGWLHIAFHVADIEKAETFLKAAGVRVEEVRGKDASVGVLVVVHDPEDNQIELFSR